MKLKLKPAVHEIIANKKTLFQSNINEDGIQGDEPLRAELYSSEQMERFGKALATKHKLSETPAKDYLLRRLDNNEDVLHAVRKLLLNAIRRKQQISPAGEWLIDNFYLIEEHIKLSKVHFPKNYSENLPHLQGGNSADLPRIYDVVLQTISHSDGRVDIESLGNFIEAYQTITYLKIGELWAIPIMLRLGLIENIRRVSARMAIDRVNANLADYWAKRMIQTVAEDPKSLILEIADMARSKPPMASAFVSELFRQLRGRGPDLALVLNWMEQQLSGTGFTSAELINIENQKQAADQVSISNSIGTLRLLSSMDWRDFVEEHSIIEKTLREDRGGIYSLMDFATRDRYRHVVETIASESNVSEYDVARIAIKQMYENAAGNEKDQRSAHVGYYLVDKGLKQTRKLAGAKDSFLQKLRQGFKAKAFAVYMFFIAVITLAMTMGIVYRASFDTHNKWLLAIIAILSLLCSSQLAISLVNFFATLLVKPVLLPRLDFSKGIPPESSTMVVVPVMLTSLADIDQMIEALEVRYLANRNQNLYFGLLTDYTDAPKEHMPEDETLLNAAIKGIELLNKKYDRPQQDLFYLFHRPRLWNQREDAWMGRERKRGKLSDLNALLRGNGDERFLKVVGDPSVFSKIKYVITLDADTQLPLDAAWKMVGTMAHPLNQAWYSEKKKRVTRGYGILQPRVMDSIPDETGSTYQRMHGNEPGIDPYTRASSDVYQDLFDEGSFIGKGIYEVDIFKKALKGKFAENKVLSHDLLEGCYVRSGLVSDIQLFEKYPGSYHTDMKRRSRWIRGDWQIISWIFPLVPGAGNKWYKNPISTLSGWKIFDNIRRSLVPIALTVLLLMGWLVLQSSVFWTILVSFIIVLPILITSIWETIRKPQDIVFMQHIKNSLKSFADILEKTFFSLICLPYEAYTNLVAIAITLWRMIITRKKMLEWNASGIVEKSGRPGLLSSYIIMWIEPFLTVVILALIAAYFPSKLVIALPILVLWAIAPYITWWTSLPLKKHEAALSREQHVFLRKMARKTWSYFERFVVQNDNWLPPDNYQEQPVAMIAHRTSPTNIGLALLANVSARDFGYISNAQLIQRTADTIGSMQKLERYRGHFFNWYETETLQTLNPRYISTVDSGNLVGHLMVLRQGLLAIPHQKNDGRLLFEGLRDTVDVLYDALTDPEKQMLEPLKAEVEKICDDQTITQAQLAQTVNELKNKLQPVLENFSNDPFNTVHWWKHLLQKQLTDIQAMFALYHPVQLMQNKPAKFDHFNWQEEPMTLYELLQEINRVKLELADEANNNLTQIESQWLTAFQSYTTGALQQASQQIATVESLAAECHSMADMDWDFLFDSSSKLLSIGFNTHEHRMDDSFYDLLASEARLTTYLCIAQGKLPVESWFALGRLLTNVDGNSVLVSWSGSMFEYLMPLLVMPSYDFTLLDQTYKAAVQWQIDYGNKTGLPWGISESSYNMISANSIYQYRAFGAPGLGLKRGLEEDAVIAPYASAMALMVLPEEACANLELMQQKGFEGRYGFYEAIDYTPHRLPRGQSHAIVYSYMVHHQGMSLLSLAYLLLDKPMQKLFEAEPQFKAALLLLQERVPKATALLAHTTEATDASYVASGSETRIINTPDTDIPSIQLLSNGKYHVMLTNAGAGFSRWKDLAVTRWREDATCDDWGTFCYIRDVETGDYWSNTHQPTLKRGEHYEAAFSQGRVDYHTVNHGIETHTEVVVSPEDDIEMRRILITNYSEEKRVIEITSYAEVVLAPAASDLIQPAFSNLFVETEILSQQHAILCNRRRRSVGDPSPWLFHLMTVQGKYPDQVSYETNRMAFIGRGNTRVFPCAMKTPGPLSGSQGSVLDPIVAIRYKIQIEPGEKITVDMLTGVADNRDICTGLVNKYQDKNHKDRVFELAWTHSQVVLRQINASEADAQLYGSIAGSILFVNPAFRADPSILINNHRQQSGLWGYSISGDLPIVLLKIEKQESMQLVRQMVQAHAYWRLKGLKVDLVIWNEEHSGYRQVFQNEILSLIPPELADRPGGIFVRVSEQVSNEDRILFQTVARVNISDTEGTLLEQVNRKTLTKTAIPYISPVKYYAEKLTHIALPNDLVFFNGYGGFTPEGNEYLVAIEEEKMTPVPWVNVIANPGFGTVVSESGAAYTWAENAHEFRLSPWNNDPVSDATGEAYYLRDEETGHYWSTSKLPAGGRGPYITRHGFGYSVFQHSEDGIYSEMLIYVDAEASIKFTVLKIRNQSGRNRKLSATGYNEWVLGDNKTKTGMHIHTEIDAATGAIFAKNPYSTEFSQRVGFFDADQTKKTFTADRNEFIGRNRNLQNPDAMSRQKLSGKIGLALDPCAAIQVYFELADSEEKEIVYKLGAGRTLEEARAIAKRFKGREAARVSFENVSKLWEKMLGALKVETPDTSINLISNGWLSYQTLSSRLWGRSGFYQSGGAFGFRDQLQDVLSLLHIAPGLARDQILLSASRQFKEGDVQHWWHPPIGRGVRTRCSDDFLWLPLVTAHYITHTGDTGILDEQVHFLEGRLLNYDEESYYDLPIQSVLSDTLYSHCVKAIRHGFNYGEHGLPLIGSGDWNDGLDKVGIEGKGESVWLAFFLYEILQKFADVAINYEDPDFAAECHAEAEKLQQNIAQHAWDGAWYKRAWFDDGQALGTSANDECRIDSIAQSWSVLSGAGDEQRVQTAMASAYEHLVQKDTGIIQLLEPAFDKSNMNPGYIKGYLPGVRENGGQYTHAAIWLIMAFAKLGDNKKVWELLSMINPVNHGKTEADIAEYKVEPYVLAADVYSRVPHAGRGGWTWYTGSAGWMYRLITTAFLGLQQLNNKLSFNPCVPQDWDSFKVFYRYKSSMYNIHLQQKQQQEKIRVLVDHVVQQDGMVTLADDAATHTVEVILQKL